VNTQELFFNRFFFAISAIAKLWLDLNNLSHDQVIKCSTNYSTPVGQTIVNYTSFIRLAKQDIKASGAKIE